MTKHFRYLIFCFAIFLIASCGNNIDEKIISQDTTISNANVITKQQASNEFPTAFDRLIWTTDFDTLKHDFFLIKNREVNADTLTPKKVIDEINSVWSEIILQFKKVSNDTIYVTIPDSYYLTERIGTSGAANYMASTTYSLTELKGIKYVNYDFEEGEHLSPGTMTRDDYKNYR
jgi:hypothetical protein